MLVHCFDFVGSEADTYMDGQHVPTIKFFEVLMITHLGKVSRKNPIIMFLLNFYVFHLTQSCIKSNLLFYIDAIHNDYL